MGLFSIVIAFEYTLFFILQSILHIDEGGAGLSLFSAVLFVPVIVKFFTSTIRHLKSKDYVILMTAAGILILFYMTRIEFGYVDPKYWGYFLSFGVRGIPAIFVAIIVAKNKTYFESMQKWLQVIMLIYTLGISLAVFTSGKSQYIQYNFGRGGLNYQTVSYCSAFAFNINVFLVLMREKRKSFKIFDNSFWKIANIILLPIQLYCLFTGGGRGAIGNIVIVLLFLLYAKRGCKLRPGAILGAIIAVCLVFFAISYFAETTGNTGAVRLMEFFGDKESVLNNERTGLRSEAIEYFWKSPISGYGIGAVHYIMGTYSHNMFTDILLEGGLLLFIPFIIIIASIFIFHKRMILKNMNNAMPYMIFLSSFMMLMFSGYYVADGGIWFAGTYLIYIITDDLKQKKMMRRESDEL